jgi:hypothetical protein
MVLTVKTLPSPESARVPLKEKLVSLDLVGSLLVLGKCHDAWVDDVSKRGD